MMGSPPGEPGRTDDEVPHRVKIRRTYAIATNELTTSILNDSSPTRLNSPGDGGQPLLCDSATHPGSL